MFLQLMSQSGFMSMLKNFDKDTINEETVELLSPYFEADDYNFENAKKVNRLALSLYIDILFFGVL